LAADASPVSLVARIDDRFAITNLPTSKA